MALCLLCHHPVEKQHFGGSDLKASSLCNYCLDQLPWRTAGCLRCGLALPATHSSCGQCLISPVNRDFTFSVFDYAFPVDRLLRNYKFHDGLEWLKPLTETMGMKISQSIPTSVLRKIDAIVPVPLHRHRLRQRGFNQCYWLGKRLSNTLGLTLQTSWCSRTTQGTPQTQRSANARRDSMTGAFTLNQAVLKAPPKTVVLLDDVITTGSTVEALARLFKVAGAEQVWVWTLASAQD